VASRENDDPRCGGNTADRGCRRHRNPRRWTTVGNVEPSENLTLELWRNDHGMIGKTAQRPTQPAIPGDLGLTPQA